MAITAFLLPALAFAGTALGQGCSTDATATITASADASAIASCTTFDGSIAIETGLGVPSGGDGHQSLAIDGELTRVTGNITVTDAINLATLSFGSLKRIGGFELSGLTVLSSLSCPQLSQVDKLNFTALPALQQLSFGNTGIQTAQDILITNTYLSSLEGIDQLQKITTFNVNNNQQLTNISLQVTNIEISLDIEANDASLSGLSTSFPMLETATNMTFRNCSSISLPALKNVTQKLGFYGNTMTEFAAPNLTTSGGLIFVDNTELTNISIPQLTSVNGSYQIANNTELKIIDGFPKLSVVTGALDFNGNFSEVNLPDLSRVAGAFNMQTSSSNFSCDAFDKNHNDKVIRGKYVCSGGVSKPRGAGTTVTSTGSGSKPSGTGAAGHIKVNYPAVIGGTSIIAGLLELLL